MRKIAIVLAASFSLGGCEPTVSTLLLPMEPTRESIDSARRELTEAERDDISDAVVHEMKPSSHRDFQWAPLVVKSHDNESDYCGLVSGDDFVDNHIVFDKYYAKLTFDHRGKLSKVDVRSIAKSKINAPPTEVDSICMQDGYGALSPTK